MGGGPPPTWQFAVAGYVPLLTGNMSLIGSSLIVYSIVGTPGRCDKLKKPHLRLLLGMSCWDIAYSFFKAWIFLFAPAGYGLPGALGNLRTCRLQGFFIGMSHNSGGYNALLSTYYWLTVCRGVKNEKWVRFEPLMHVAMPAFFITLGGISIWQNLYNPLFSFCWIAAYPPGCEMGPGAPPCLYHHQRDMPFLSEVYSNMFLQFYVIWVCLTNFFIWWKVYRQERANRKYIAKIERRARRTRTLLLASSSFTTEDTVERGEQQQQGQQQQQRDSFRESTTSAVQSLSTATAGAPATTKKQMSRDKQVLIQSVLYAGCFFLSWLGPVLFHLMNWFNGFQSFTWMTLIVIFTPMQGFFNAFVYGRPTFIRIRRKYPYVTRWDAFKRIFFAEDPMAAVCSTDGSESSSTARSPGQVKRKTASAVRAQVGDRSKASRSAASGSRFVSDAIVSEVIPEGNEEEQDEHDDDEEDLDFDPNDPASSCSQLEDYVSQRRSDAAAAAAAGAHAHEQNNNERNNENDSDNGKTSDPSTDPTSEIQYVESLRSLRSLDPPGWVPQCNYQ